jgi:hypothetical protein
MSQRVHKLQATTTELLLQGNKSVRQQTSNATNKQARKATNKQANKATANKSIERVTTDIQVHIPLPHIPSFSATSSSLGHNLSSNFKLFSATTDVDNKQDS